MLLRAGQSPFEPRLVTVPDGLQTERESHLKQQVGSRMESPPSGTWTESCQTPILWQSSSSRVCAPQHVSRQGGLSACAVIHQ